MTVTLSVPLWLAYFLAALCAWSVVSGVAGAIVAVVSWYLASDGRARRRRHRRYRKEGRQFTSAMGARR
jgi:uncharacterized protein (DUF2062 family)